MMSTPTTRSGRTSKLKENESTQEKDKEQLEAKVTDLPKKVTRSSSASFEKTAGSPKVASPRRPRHGSSKDFEDSEPAVSSQETLPQLKTRASRSNSKSDVSEKKDSVDSADVGDVKNTAKSQDEKQTKASSQKKANPKKSPVRAMDTTELTPAQKNDNTKSKLVDGKEKQDLSEMQVDSGKSSPIVKAAPVTPGTPSAVRRSSRAPVPSSRLKDMEIGLKKRSLPSEGTDTESDSEPSKKKARTARKSQHKSPKHVAESSELPVSEISAEQLTVDTVNVKAALEVESFVENQSGISTDEINGSNNEKISVLEAEAHPGTSTEEHFGNVVVENAGNIQVEQSVEEEVVVEMGEEVVHSHEVSTTKVAETVAVEKTPSLLEQHLHSLLPTQKVSLAEAHIDTGQTSQDVSSSAMEGDYALIEEKDLAMVQNAMTKTPVHQESSEDLMSKDIQQVLSGLKGLEGSSKHITFTESNGQTVAIITISPPNASNETATVQSGVTPVVQETPLRASPHAADTRPQQHGYIVKETKSPQQPFATVMTESGTTYVNLAVEPTTISNILTKSPQVSKPTGKSSKDFGGRVLKPDNPLGVLGKTTLAAPPTPVSIVSPPSSSIKAPAPSGQVYSLLTPKRPGTRIQEPAKVGQSLLVNSPRKPVILHGSISKDPAPTTLPGQKVVIVNQSPAQLASSSTIDTSSALGRALQGDLSSESTSAPSEKTPAVVMVDETSTQPLSATPGKTVIKITHTPPAAAAGSSSNQSVLSTPGKISTLPLPKMATSSLLQKLKEQAGRVIIKESSNASKLVQASPQVPPTSTVVITTTPPLPSDQNKLTEAQEIQETQFTQLAQSSVDQSSHSQETEDGQLQRTVSVELVKASEEDLENSVEEQSVQIVSDDLYTAEDGNDQQESHEEEPEQIASGIIQEVLEEAEKLIVDAQEEGESAAKKEEMSMSSESQAVVEVGSDESLESRLEKMGKICIVDNGVEYEVKLVQNEEEEMLTDKNESQDFGKENELTAIDVKQELMDGVEVQEVDASAAVDIQNLIEGKQTSGTQTAYTLKSGEVVKKQVFTASDGPIHKLSTVVNEDGQKRQYYYVSVVLNKDFDGKYKTTTRSSSAPCVVNDDGMYCCGKCNYKTDRKANFYKHRRLHTGAKPHTCPVCNYKAGTSSNLKRHMGIHEDIRQHKCPVCNLCFRQKIHLERHIKYKHEEKRVKCPLCNYVCANEQPDLRMHMKRKHYSETSGEISVCPTCRATFSSKKDLKQHMKFHKDGPELKLFCKECSFVTDCQSRLKRHSAIHEKVKPFMCSICQYRAAQKEHVLRHLRTQHKIEVKREGKRGWKRRTGSEKQTTEKVTPTEVAKEKADFSSGDKIFACNHCTMRFAKLINLYKHLHTQHSDIMPPETEGNYYCVVCEFFTHTKKALLIHMRRHNITDQTPPTHVFSCVLCRYVTPRRRNLFQHMRKKHNIDISQQVEMEGEEEDEENGAGTSMVESQDDSLVISGDIKPVLTTELGADGQQQTIIATTSATVGEKAEPGGKIVRDDLAGMANMIKIEDLTRVSTSGGEVDPNKLVIDTRSTQVQNEEEQVTTETPAIIQHHSADALEGLQALAEQAGLIDNIIEEQVPVVAEQQTVDIEHAGAASTSGHPTISDGSIIITGDGSTIAGEGQVVETVTGEQIHYMVDALEEVTEQASVEVTEDQLSSLQAGDIVEMDGELYLVEMSQDPNNPDKQLLSFLPVNTSS